MSNRPRPPDPGNADAAKACQGQDGEGDFKDTSETRAFNSKKGGRASAASPGWTKIVDALAILQDRIGRAS